MSAFAQQIRPWFLARQRREKLLAMVFFLAIAIVWLISFAGRAREFQTRLQIVRSDNREQQTWLDRKAATETRFEAAVAALSPEKFPSGAEVNARVDELVRKHGFPPNIDFPPAKNRDRLSIHTINITINKVDYDRLRGFQRELSGVLPTVHLKQIKVSADKANPAQLSARLVLEAIEFKR